MYNETKIIKIIKMNKYILGQTFDLRSYMKALNNEYERRKKHNSIKGKEGRWN